MEWERWTNRIPGNGLAAGLSIVDRPGLEMLVDRTGRRGSLRMVG